MTELIHRKLAKVLINSLDTTQLDITPLHSETIEKVVLSVCIKPTRKVRVITINGEIWEAQISEFYCTDEEHAKKVVGLMWDNESWSQWFTKLEMQ